MNTVDAQYIIIKKSPCQHSGLVIFSCNAYSYKSGMRIINEYIDKYSFSDPHIIKIDLFLEIDNINFCVHTRKEDNVYHPYSYNFVDLLAEHSGSISKNKSVRLYARNWAHNNLDSVNKLIKDHIFN